MKEWMKRICPCFTLSGITLEKQYLFHGSVRFQLFIFFVSSQTLYNIHVTWFDWFLRWEGESAPH